MAIRVRASASAITDPGYSTSLPIGRERPASVCVTACVPEDLCGDTERGSAVFAADPVAVAVEAVDVAADDVDRTGDVRRAVAFASSAIDVAVDRHAAAVVRVARRNDRLRFGRRACIPRGRTAVRNIGTTARPNGRVVTRAVRTRGLPDPAARRRVRGMDPQGRIAVVTGAAGGIGSALVRALVAAGADTVVATDVRADAIDAMATTSSPRRSTSATRRRPSPSSTRSRRPTGRSTCGSPTPVSPMAAAPTHPTTCGRCSGTST